MRPEPGTSLGGRYTLEERLAGGGMGAVWRGNDSVLGREVAVKVMSESLTGESDFLERFRAEARSAASLSHPGVAQVFDYGEQDGSPYLVMELVPGLPLSALLSREGPFDVNRTLDLVGQASLALDAAHAAGVVHRDVKPGNLLVTPEGKVKVTDFGIARVTGAVPLTQTGTVMGTAQYLSPETAAGQPATAASDVYSLGVVAYECLAGAPPFGAETPLALAMSHVRDPVPPLPDTIPAPVRDLVMQCLEKEPDARPASAGALGTAALALRSGAGQGTVPMAAASQPLAGAATGATRRLDGPGRHGGRPAGPRGKRGVERLPKTLLAVLVLAGLGLGALLLSSAFDVGDPSSSPQAAGADGDATGEATAPARSKKEPRSDHGPVQIVPANYVGRPMEQVSRELRAQGLHVDLKGEEDNRIEPYLVTKVEPEGTVQPGETVEVKYAVPKSEKSKGRADGGHGGPGKGNSGHGD